jgi:hypothetical protein
MVTNPAALATKECDCIHPSILNCWPRLSFGRWVIAGRRPVEAIEQLNKCVELNPLNVKCWLYICVSKVQSQDMRGAATVFDRAWSLIPMALHDDEHNDEMMLVHKLRGIFQNAGPPPPRSPPHGDEL